MVKYQIIGETRMIKSTASIITKNKCIILDTGYSTKTIKISELSYLEVGGKVRIDKSIKGYGLKKIKKSDRENYKKGIIYI